MFLSRTRRRIFLLLTNVSVKYFGAEPEFLLKKYFVPKI